MLTVEQFLENGYKRFENKGKQVSSADFGLQKRIEDDIGKKYFITVWVYDWTKYPWYNHPKKLSFAPDVQLQLQSGMHVNMEMLLNDDSTIEEIEAFFEKAWVEFDCQYYEKWD